MRHFLYGLFAGFILLNPALAPALAQDLPTDFEDSDVFGGTGDFEIEEDSGAAGGGWGRYIGGSIGAVTADGDVVSRQLTALRLDIDLPANDRLKTVLSIDAVDFENSYTRELREHFKRNRDNCARLFADGVAPSEPKPAPPPESRPSVPRPPSGPGDVDRHAREEAQFAIDIAEFQRLERLHRSESETFNDWNGNSCEDLRNEADTAYIPEEIETKISDNFVDFREAYVQWEPTDYATLSVGRQNLV